MSLKARLLIAVITLVVLNVLIMGIGSVNIAVSRATDAQIESTKKNLQSQTYQTRLLLEDYFTFVEAQIRSKSFDLSTVEAARSFVTSFNLYGNNRGRLTPAEQDSLTSYYQNDFANKFNQLNVDGLDSVTPLLAGLNDNALALQHDFIASSTFPIGEKDKLTETSRTTSYSAVHKKYHPSLRKFQQQFGYYDVFLADISTGNIVYSVFKELDFATSLTSGPYADSGIGDVFRRAANASDTDEVFFSEFSSYFPSFNAFAGFVASPIFSEGQPVAVLIFQLPIENINRIMTHGEKWRQAGLGDTGETFLVNPQGYMLSESRAFIENPEQFLRELNGASVQQAAQIRARQSTVGQIKVDSPAVKLALQGKSGFVQSGEDEQAKIKAYDHLVMGEQTLALVAQINAAETMGAVEEISTGLITSAAIEMVVQVTIAAIVALWFANKLVNPLNKLGDTCEALTQGEGDLTLQLEHSGIPEVDRISDNFNIFIEQIRLIISQVKEDADALASAANELKVVTTESEKVTMEQRDQTAKVAAAIKDLNDSVHEISHSTNATSNQSLEAQKSLKENMERAEMAAENIKLLVELLQDSSVVISGLKNEVNQITSMLGVITGIADQTNLLALNAAIEAARAGDAGRGFSVVADEVRALANRSQENTEEISKLVDVMISSSGKSVERMERAATAADGGIHLVDLVSTAMDELGANLSLVMDMTEKVSSTTDYQNATSDQVLVSVKQISRMAEEVEQGAHQTSESANQLAQIAEHAQNLVARFKV